MMKIALRLFSWWLWTPLIIGLVSCDSTPEVDSAKTDQLIVFAAASLTDSFTELEEAFEADNPGTDVVLNFASSSQLAFQLREGAAADVFASANENQMQMAVASGRVDPFDVVSFTANKLTILVPAGNPAEIRTIEDLGNPGVSLLVAVEGVPARDYADQIIRHLPGAAGGRIYGNLVSEESNVRQVSTKVALGEADAGIVYVSDITPDIADQVEQIQIPDALNVIASYPIATIQDSRQEALAKDFIEFVLSDAGQAILANWGFASLQTNIAY